MQVKKFEAPTIQEALDTIKRELGPDAIILQTKKYKRGFGLMSRASVEVTAAVSERSLQKKQYVEQRLPESTRDAVKKLPAERQAEFFDKAVKGTRAASREGTRAPAPSSSRPAGQAAGARATVPAPARSAQVGASNAYQAMQASGVRSASGRAGAAPVDQLLGRRDAIVSTSGRASPHSSRPQSPMPAARPVRAAPDDDDEPARTHASSQVTERRYAEIDDDISEMDSAGARSAGEAGVLGFRPLEAEVHQLKRMIEELKSVQDSQDLSGSGARALLQSSGPRSGQAGALSTPALQGAFEQLVINGLEKRYAHALIRTVAFELGPQRSEDPDQVLDGLAAEIMKTTAVLSPFEGFTPSQGPGAAAGSDRRRGPVIVALVGPTGVGKTTTVAKLASEAILKRSLRVGLINLDSYKIAAFDQLGTYAKILNVPFRSVATGDELRAAIQDFQPLDLVLVDTTGRSQRDPAALKEMQETLTAVPEARAQLVLSVTTRDAELYDMANRFSIFRPEGIIVSKLDETATYGSIYNVAHRVQLPLLCFTTGQRVPEDIEDATRERVAALLLDI